MVKIFTERLDLIPLSLKELELSLNSINRVEESLGLFSTNRELNGKMKKVYQIKIDKMSGDVENDLFYTYWQIVLRKENRIIGELGFKGKPDKSGEVEVGYGLQLNYRGQGYMTEALFELISWAFKQPGVSAILASTDLDNYASQAVLKRIGMRPYKEENYLLWWRIEKV